MIQRALIPAVLINLLSWTLALGAGSAVPDSYDSLMKMFSSLVIVLAILFLVLFLGKRFFGESIGIKQKNKMIKILSTSYIGNKKSLILVEAMGEKVLLGVSGTDISMLTRINGKSENPDVPSPSDMASDSIASAQE